MNKIDTQVSGRPPCLALVFVISLLEWGCTVCINACTSGRPRGLDVQLWLGLLFDSASAADLPDVACVWVSFRTFRSCRPFQAVQILGSLPFLLMIFLSTTPSVLEPVSLSSRSFVIFLPDSTSGVPSQALWTTWKAAPSAHDRSQPFLPYILTAFVGVPVFLAAKKEGFQVQACQKGAEKSKDADKRKQMVMEMEEAQL
jgi:hypothetical protein